MAQPGHADSIPFVETDAALSEAIDDTDHFMTRDYQVTLGDQIALGEVEIGTANSTDPHVDPDLP
jgi:hypothetical protein